MKKPPLKTSKQLQTDFITLTSHQLRTPLSGMKWLLELLQKSDTGNLNRKQKEFLEQIYNSNERMIALVNDLLEISRLEAGESQLYLQPTDLASVCRIIVKEKEKEVKRKHLQVTLTVEQEPFPLVRTEPIKIKQALGNIINNAVVFTPPHGKIDIILNVVDGKVQGEISDNGPGIPAGQQDQVFKKFFRGSNVMSLETNGSGLGLYISKAFIEASGGTIRFRSKEGKGTTFLFTLPISH
ncbi:MAG: HAMP domain-containing histidine kinase [Candidatus Doudnabacteria bacterium]|nr:HAMP domain-containing histidine kinase [Candidatus Doudnabacteria bacterium]